MISTLLPVRNGAKTLHRAIASLHAQSLADGNALECVVVDDGSIDATPALLDAWTARWNRLRVLRTDGLGIARALNVGLAACRGEWIARLDADDRCHPLRLERQLATARQAKASIVGCLVHHAVEDEYDSSAYEGMRRHVAWANGLTAHDELERALWVDSPLPHPSWLVERRAFDIVGPYDEREGVPEDYDWLHRFFQVARSNTAKSLALRAAKTAGEPLLDSTDSPSRLTRTKTAYNEEAFNRVKARALAVWIEQTRAAGREAFVCGLGPKGKAIFPMLRPLLPIRAIVDVRPGRIGARYHGVEIWDVARWLDYIRDLGPDRVLALNCLGTAEARNRAEGLCLKAGLEAGRSFLSF